MSWARPKTEWHDTTVSGSGSDHWEPTLTSIYILKLRVMSYQVSRYPAFRATPTVWTNRTRVVYYSNIKYEQIILLVIFIIFDHYKPTYSRCSALVPELECHIQNSPHCHPSHSKSDWWVNCPRVHARHKKMYNIAIILIFLTLLKNPKTLNYRIKYDSYLYSCNSDTII